MPLISVIIPVYNSIKYLDACVRSVLKFQNVDLECILVDDGSSDGSGGLCDRIALSDNRVIVIHQPNSGVSTARNNGIKRATGSYIYFLDSDDICLINDLDFLLCNYDLIIGQYAIGQENKHFIVQSVVSSDIPEISFLREYLKTCIGSFFVRRDIIVENNILFPADIKYGEDQEFILKMMTGSKNVLQSNEAFCLYRTRLSSAMHKITLTRFDVAVSRIRLMNYYKSRNINIYRYLGNKAVLESIITVCESLFRFSMPFNQVWSYIKNNNEIQAFLSLDRQFNGLQEIKEINKLKSPIYIKWIQIRVLWNSIIYKTRCLASKLYHMFIKQNNPD